MVCFCRTVDFHFMTKFDLNMAAIYVKGWACVRFVWAVKQKQIGGSVEAREECIGQADRLDGVLYI